MNRKEQINFGEEQKQKTYFENMDPIDKIMMMITERQIIHFNVHCLKHSISTVAAVNREFREVLTESQKIKLETALDGISTIIAEICDENDDVINFLLPPAPVPNKKGGF